MKIFRANVLSAKAFSSYTLADQSDRASRSYVQ